MTSEMTAAPDGRAKSWLEWGVVSAGLAGGVAVAIAGAGYGLTNATGVGAGFFPLVAGVVIAAGAALWGLQLVADRRRRLDQARRPVGGSPSAPDASRVDPPTDTAIGVLVVDGIDEEDDDIDLPTRRGVLRVAIVALALVLGAVLLPFLGYAVTMTLMLFAVMTLVSARAWWTALLVAVVAAFASRFVFETLLGTALPHAAIPFIRAIGL